MSGHKRATISISEDEYRRLHEAEMKLRFMPKKTSELSYFNEQVQTAIIDHLDQVRNRQDEFSQLLESLDGNIRSIELQTSSGIVENQIHFAEQLSSSIGTLQDRVDALLEQQAERFNEMIITEHSAQQSEIITIRQSVDQITMNFQRKAELAQNWIKAAEGLFEFIDVNYYHHQFDPSALNQYNAKLSQSIRNFEEGASEAALIQAQDVYLHLSELRLKLERYENEWSSLYQAAWEAVYQLLDIANDSRMCSAHDLDGQELPILVDSNYWSNGELQRAIDAIEELGLRLQTVDISLTDLNQILKNELPRARKSVEQAIFLARLAVLNSQLRINIADLVIEALQKQGYILQQAEYSRDDQRLAYSAKVRNLEGNEIVIQVHPCEEMGMNELHLVSLDREQRTEHELRQRSFEVTRSLSNYGLKVDNLRSVGNDRKSTNSQPIQKSRAKQVTTYGR
jgi:ferritin-like metal-binding protein YciE